LGYLFGLVAAVAGCGWALHLSYQSDSTTATDGGVVTRNNQGNPVTHTGFGDSHQGDRIEKQENTYIHIGIRLEEYEAGLRRREQEVTQELEQAHEKDRRLLEAEKAEIERRLADTQASYQTHIEELQQRIVELQTIRGQVPEALLDEARATLAQGDRSRADSLFARIETENEVAVLATAEATYQRSQIAQDQVRYRTAYGPPSGPSGSHRTTAAIARVRVSWRGYSATIRPPRMIWSRPWPSISRPMVRTIPMWPETAETWEKLGMHSGNTIRPTTSDPTFS